MYEKIKILKWNVRPKKAERQRETVVTGVDSPPNNSVIEHLVMLPTFLFPGCYWLLVSLLQLFFEHFRHWSIIIIIDPPAWTTLVLFLWLYYTYGLANTINYVLLLCWTQYIRNYFLTCNCFGLLKRT